MQHLDLVGELQAMLSIVMYACLPPLLGALAVGLVVGILQAVTQVQDQSMPLTFKLLAVVVVLVVGGASLVVPLVRQTEHLFDNFSAATR